MKKTVIGALALLGTLTVNPVLAKETISAVGSSSVTPLMEVFSETYMKTNGNVFIEVQGPGSSAGVKAAKNGSADLGMSSRNLKDSEKEPALKEVVVARDGIAVVVNPKNGVKELTAAQVTAIYKGEVTNWSQVGGANKPIVAITRDTASGTRGAFEDIMKLKKKIAGKKVSAISQRAQVANGNGALKTMVASNPFAIGYISLGTVDSSVQALAIDGTAATVDNVKNGSYKVARPFLVLYKEGKPSAETQKFLDWMVAAEAQSLVAKKGYITVN
ncbi:putative ABC-type phosphate transport system,periplasmic component [Vibrio nigripulchritudo MADA3029]|uniref:Phosphate-binding protein n=3 Tax=Vibrio nigripulchritudo TaxID=28173 RepID=U4KB88_9VIBR|nr:MULTISPECIES: phosphate ABC transporter substrate-binding protein [Vibrio]KJY73576.1 phosphate ABC transporter substrate-binding protein [Vibrio nigripulchritudo]UAB73453.1 phosphate ABC transporter substrate-binding protein [Vibrio sp. SCSIO 43132]CCN32961.1 putative ABC-type phosphate transport system,periplasmic component [Vibrio nigripulchritudo AM115]CCN44105.1 putative ABC-type phosphate transport system,periplasmic component [Vibrio nigripulchritudo FTn2]CCN49625.1 putative ABC-type 